MIMRLMFTLTVAMGMTWGIAAEVASAQPTLPSIETLRDQALADRDKKYDPEMRSLRATGGGPGYHTRTKAGQVVHSTRDSADYAQMLLMNGRPADCQRAAAILERLVEMQVTDPSSQHYGLWGWYVEEPPQDMAPADWNWADFIGARLAEILKRHATSLDAALVTRLRTALGHAARCIVKRNVGPSYTNICAMGAGVTLAAGEIMGDEGLLAYGRKRLNAQRVDCERNGGVPEYNSPTYSMVLIHELERILRLVEDPAARTDAEWMRRRMWTLIADQFHPGTGQWSGAQSRAYSDLLQPAQVLFLWQRTGVAIRSESTTIFAPGCDDLHADPEAVCPPELTPRFAKLPNDPHEVRQVWMRNAAGEPQVILNSWFTADACLGSVNRETTWVQHHAITGYWQNGAANVASMRVRFLKDGRDFASGMMWTQQRGPRALVVLGMAAGQGDWHCSLDKPKDGLFTGSDLRVRCEVTGAGATCTAAGTGRWELSSGSRRLVVHTSSAWFNGHEVAWETGQHDKTVWVDAVYHTGSPLTLAPAKLEETLAVMGLELLSANENPAVESPTTEIIRTRRRCQWTPVGEPLLVPRSAGR